jgi:hypothetical protein
MTNAIAARRPMYTIVPLFLNVSGVQHARPVHLRRRVYPFPTLNSRRIAPTLRNLPVLSNTERFAMIALEVRVRGESHRTPSSVSAGRRRESIFRHI